VRVAVLCDIHGNPPALDAVLAEAMRDGADALVIGGDAAAGAMPRETIERLMALERPVHFVRGNADREIVECYDRGLTAIERLDDPALRSAAFAAGRISPAQRDFLAGFAQTVVLELAGLGPTLFCHGSPRSDTEIITRITPDARLREILAGVDQAVVVGGHTHQQFDRVLDRWRFVNAGSVGMPYEGTRGAYWALLGPDVALRRTDYDVDRALAQMRGGSFPDLEEMLRESLIEPVDPAEVAEFFEAQATGAAPDDPDR